MIEITPTRQPRSSSMDGLYGWLLSPFWPSLHKNKERIRLLPNVLTTLRLCLAPLAAMGLGTALKADTGAWPIASWSLVVVILFASDGLDGTLANRLGIVSRYGRIVDPIADKVLVMCLLYVLVQAGNLLLPHDLATTLAIMVGVRVVIDLVLVAITFGEAASHRRPQAEKWGKRKLAADALTVILLTTGIGLTSCGHSFAGTWTVALSCSAILIASYMGIRSIRGHWANLRTPTPAI